MKRTALIASTAFALLASAPAMAQDSQVYINAGVDAFEFDAYTLSGKLGYNFNDYFGVEGQAGIGIGGTDDSRFNEVIDGTRIVGDVSTEVDSSFAAFARVKFPVTDRVEVFARGGYHFTQFGIETSDFALTTGDATGIITGRDDNVDLDGIALGAGAQFMLNPMSGIRIEYTFLDVEEIEGIDIDDFGDDFDFGEVGSDVYSISYVRRF